MQKQYPPSGQARFNQFGWSPIQSKPEPVFEIPWWFVGTLVVIFLLLVYFL